MRPNYEVKISSLDPEWMELMKEAMELGLSIQEVLDYIADNKDCILSRDLVLL